MTTAPAYSGNAGQALTATPHGQTAPSARQADASHRAELQLAIDCFGSQRALAKAINTYIAQHRLNARPVQQQNVCNWLHRDLRIPRDYPPVIEAVCGGRVSCRALRGDG